MSALHPSRAIATTTILLGGVLLLTVTFGALYALYGVTERYNTMIDNRMATLNNLNEINLLFKTQVQEWKNTLLRGQDQKDREHYWQAFLATETEVNLIVKKVEGRQLSNETRKALLRFIQSHARLGQLYRQGFEMYVANDLNHRLVDSTLRGIDREPTERLSEFTHQLEQEIRTEGDRLNHLSDRYFIITLMLVGLCSVIVATGVIAVVRSAIETEVSARTRSDFLAKMSHELRTPMNGVLGMSELLNSTPLNEQQRRYNQTIHSSGQSLLILINDLLDYSRIEAGKMSLENLSFSLRGALSNLFYLFVQQAVDKGLQWHIDIAPDIPDELLGDPVRINQILANIVSNAFKFTQQGSVRLNVSLQEHYLVFQCIDTGMGMEQDVLKQLFTPFNQADSSISRRFGGTGLGLVISRELARQMHGDLEVSSEPKQGSQFSVRLPLQESASPHRKVVTNPFDVVLCVEDREQRADYLRNCVHWQLPTREYDPATAQPLLASDSTSPSIMVIDVRDHQLSDTIAASARAQGYLSLQLYDIGQSNEWISSHGEVNHGFKDRPPFGALLLPLLKECLDGGDDTPEQSEQHVGIRPLNILAADDNSVNRSVISAMLAKLGHKCTLACDGEDAVTQYVNTSRRFDLVLMDCEMPVLDGLGALRCIREIEQQRQLPPTPILALTANAYQSDRERYLEAGMDDVLTKPISLDRLKTALNQHSL